VPGERHQDLTSTVKVVGAGQAAEELAKVAGAQETVAKETATTGQAAAAASDAQKKLSASESDVIGVLTRINPMLGGMADALLKGGKIAGDLASTNINLTEVFGSLTAAVKANAAALKLIGASGAVLLGIYAIVHAFGSMREEAERATKAIQDQIDALNELRKAEQTRAQTLEDIADTRREGGYATAEEAKAAAQRAGRVGERSPHLDEQAILRAVALAGAQRDTGDLEKIAWLIQTDRVKLEPGMGADSRERRIESALNRHGEVIEKSIQREAEQRKEIKTEARREAVATEGSTLNLEKVVRDAMGPAATEENTKAMMELVRQFPNMAALEEGLQGRTRALWDVFRGRSEMVPAGEQGRAVPGTVVVSDLQVAELTKVLKALEQRQREERGGTTIINHNQHSRNTYPDARARQRATRNGQRLVRDAMEG